MNKKELIKTSKIEVLCSPEQKKEAQILAKESNKSLSSFGLERILKGYSLINNTVIKENKSSNSNGFDHGELLGIGKNLNQLTRYSHQTGKFDERLFDVINALEKILKK